MSNPIWFVNLIKKIYPYSLTLAKLTRVPGLGRLTEWGLFENDDIMYLPKDRTIPVNRTVGDRADMVLPSQVVDRFIHQARHHWIMNNCICRESLACRNHPIELGCLFLGEAVHGINPELGRLVTATEALRHVQRCREAGLVHLIGRNKLDAVWLNVGPGNRLLTICNCCSCCCLWRILPEVAPRIGSKVSRMLGVQVTVTDRCLGCGTCINGVCFARAIRMEGHRARIAETECRGCGRCADICPNGAIEVTVTDPGYVEAAVARLGLVVDVH